MATGQVNLTGGSSGRLVLRVSLLLAIVGAIFAVAFLQQCDTAATGNIQRVKLNGKSFFLEVADTDVVRTKGLGQRTHIEADGGMLFVFPTPKTSSFVMRDCYVDIDIIYLDQYGKITAMYEMKKEELRRPDEGQLGEFSKPYEDRLKKYDSRFPTQFVIELKGGTLPGLNLKDGDKIDLPLAALKNRAQ